MHRQIVWSGAIPLETDLLNTNKYTMVALAKLAAAIMGTSTYANGLACTPTSPASMTVNIAPGEIYSLQNIDGTAYSSLTADTTHSILKQGYVLDSQSFTLTAPTTSGFSVNYLVQATYSDTDGGSTVLPYYNASNPSTAWSGPNNSGTAQYTVRQGICTVSLKSGVAATTGTQTTPSVDTGYTGLYVITVAYGASTVTAANISTYTNAPFLPSAGLVDGIQRNVMRYSADSGTANAYVVNMKPGILSLSAGTEVIFRATSANTGSSTLNVSATGAYPILNKFGATLIAGEIAAGSIVKVIWSATTSSWFLLDATSSVPTAPTAAPGTNTTQAASTAFLQAAITALLLGTASQRDVGTGTNQIPDMNSFASSLATNGYYKLPGGLIIQWLTVTGSTSATVPVTFPLPFPNQLFGTAMAMDWTSPGYPTLQSQTLVGVSVNTWNNSGTRSALAVTIIAVGK